MIAGFILAGLNHFRIPQFYISIMPLYFPFPAVLNILAGIFELLFGILLIFKITRVWAAWGIVLLLIAFIPVHVNMLGFNKNIQIGKLNVTPLTAWLRLLLQPVLIWWAWWHTRPDND